MTGATGFVASHVVGQFLERGYRVRGTVRDFAKASWLVDDVFKSYAADGKFELTRVVDLAAANAFDEAVKGVSVIVHVASIVNFDPDPNKVIPQTALGASSIMAAALKEPSVREFVYTSSLVAATMPMPGNTTRVERDTWNDAALQLAWAPPPHAPGHGFIVYMASKVEAERALWKFVEERKPQFNVNSVCASSILGEPLNKSHTESPVAFVKHLCDGNTAIFNFIPASQLSRRPITSSASQDSHRPSFWLAN